MKNKEHPFYSLSFDGELINGFSKDQVLSNLTNIFKDAEKAKKFFQGPRVIIKSSCPKEEAINLKDKFERIGMKLKAINISFVDDDIYYYENNEKIKPDKTLTNEEEKFTEETSSPEADKKDSNENAFQNSILTITAPGKIKKTIRGFAHFLVAFAVIDFLGMFFNYDLTGSSRSPIFFGCLAMLLYAFTRNKIVLNKKAESQLKCLEVTTDRNETPPLSNLGTLSVVEDSLIFVYHFNNQEKHFLFKDLEVVKVYNKIVNCILYFVFRDGVIIKFHVLQFKAKPFLEYLSNRSISIEDLK